MEWWLIVLVAVGLLAVGIGGMLWVRDERRRRARRHPLEHDYTPRFQGPVSEPTTEEPAGEYRRAG